MSRTRAKGNVLDAVSYPIGGVTMGDAIDVVGGINTGDGPGDNDALIVDGNQDYLFPTGRVFDVVGGPNAGTSYVVLSPGAEYNNLVNSPHIANTTEIPVASVNSISSGGTIAGYGIDLGGTIITNSGTPVESTDVATKDYVDSSLSSVTIGPSNLSPSPPDYDIDISGDADTVDNLHGTQFLRSDTSDTLVEGSITLQSASTRYVSFNDTAGSNNPGISMQTGGSNNAGALIDNVNSVGNGYLRLYRYTSGGAFAAQINLFENGNITIDPAGSTTHSGNFNVTGNITATGNVTAFSDVRLKEDIRTIDNAMDKIVQITGYTFTRNDLDDDKRYAGVIAQEVQHVLPEVVEKSEDGMLSVAYGNLVALLIEGMKEQKKEIDDLKKRLDKVEE